MASEPGLSAGLRSGAAAAPDADPWGHLALLQRARLGDPRAWEAIVQRHAAAVHLAAAQHGLPEVDVALAERTTWLRLTEHLDRLEHDQWLGPWLTRTADAEARRLVARRECLDEAAR